MSFPHTIFEACQPRKDVESGVTRDEQFAADLAQVINETAPNEYLDPAVFFRHTYPTRGLKDLLKQVCNRLNGESNVSPVMRLHTQYGGGKTHGLIALVHAVRGMRGVENSAAFIDSASLPKSAVRIAALDGENSDPANGRPFPDGTRAFTLWGELAHELAGAEGYASVRVSDEKFTAPGAEVLRKLFGDAPTLIILDEISVYLRKAEQAHPGSAKQFTAFIHALFKAVESSPRAAVVLTLALGKEGKSSDAYAEENRLAFEAFREAESVTARKSTQLDPTGDDETAQVLRTRLFASVDDKASEETYAAYRQTWESNRGMLPADVISREEFLACYPLHPKLLSVLTEKTSSLDTFQRTRGMLRLLARTVHFLWKNKPADAFTIHAHHVNPGFDRIRDEITIRLNQGNYIAPLKSDVAEMPGASQATAQTLDAKLYPGQLPGVSYAARTIFLHTIAGVDSVRGISPEDLRLSVCSPALEPAFVEQARLAFVTESLFLDDTPGARLKFMTEPNLTMLIRRKMMDVTPGAVEERLAIEIRKAYAQPGGAFSLCQFPGGPYQVPDDTERPQLVVMDYRSVHVHSDPATLPFEIEDIWQHKGTENKLRKYRNNLVFLVAEERLCSTILEHVRRLIALEDLSKNNVKDLPKHQQADLSSRKSKSELETSSAILQCYRHLFYPAKVAMPGSTLPLAHFAIQFPIGKAGNGQYQVKTALEELKKLVDAKSSTLNPSYIRDCTVLKNKGELSTRDFRDEFRSLPGLPMLEEDTPFVALVRSGIEKEVFVYREGTNQVTGPGDPLSAVHIDDNCFVMTMEYAKGKYFWPRPEPLRVQLRSSSSSVQPGTTIELTAEISGGVGPYTCTSSLSGFNQSAPTTQSVFSTRTQVESTTTFSVTVQDHLGNKQAGSAYVVVAENAKPHDVLPPEPDILTPRKPPTSAVPPPQIELNAEGPLGTALKELWDKARKAKVNRLQRVVVTMHDPIATWKVHSAMVIEKRAAISCEFTAEMVADGIEDLNLTFRGNIAKADLVRAFLDPVLRSASQKNFQATYTLQFTAGLLLAGTDPENLTSALTKFGGTEAYVEAHAQDQENLEEVAA